MLSVVTSCWGTYGRYLDEWATSVAAARPAAVVIAELGDCAKEARAAARLLHGQGILTTVVSEPYSGMGAARNNAVEATRTEWVMHLDADDLLLPDTLSRVGALTDTADVVSLAARYQSGKERSFPQVSARTILAGRVGCFSCSPYRRSLWEAAPYPTAPLFVDRLLWVGFAHQGARFIGTRRPGFIYRQHLDSFKRTLGPVELAAARKQLREAVRRPAPC